MILLPWDSVYQDEPTHLSSTYIHPGRRLELLSTPKFSLHNPSPKPGKNDPNPPHPHPPNPPHHLRPHPLHPSPPNRLPRRLSRPTPLLQPNPILHLPRIWRAHHPIRRRRHAVPQRPSRRAVRVSSTRAPNHRRPGPDRDTDAPGGADPDVVPGGHVAGCEVHVLHDVQVLAGLYV